MNFRSKRKSACDVYINDPIDTDREGNQLTLLDIMSEEEDIVGKIDLQMKARQLREYIDSCLDSREQTIIALRYGLDNRRPLTQREVAKQLGISRSYVSRIEKRAVGILRDHFEADGHGD